MKEECEYSFRLKLDLIEFFIKSTIKWTIKFGEIKKLNFV